MSGQGCVRGTPPCQCQHSWPPLPPASSGTEIGSKPDSRVVLGTPPVRRTRPGLRGPWLPAIPRAGGAMMPPDRDPWPAGSTAARLSHPNSRQPASAPKFSERHPVDSFETILKCACCLTFEKMWFVPKRTALL